MKDRDYKIFKPGFFYHIFNRGNNKTDIFLEENDYLNFLRRAKLALGLLPKNETLHIHPLNSNDFAIASYCLMPNHFHFLIKQTTDTTIDRLITKICTSYAAYFNKKYQRVGHLFQDAFKAKVIDNDAYLLNLSLYIHNNPPDPFEYPYSSLQDILGVRQGQICNRSEFLNLLGQSPDQYKTLMKNFNQAEEAKITHLCFED